jgi:hypothetical protein
VTISDTDPETERILTELLRQAPVWRKMEMMAELNRTATHLALEGLRERHPNASEAVLRRLLADLILGHELALKAYGPLPEQKQDEVRLEP